MIDVDSIMTGDWQAVEPAGTSHAAETSEPVKKATASKGASKNAAVRKSK